MNKREKQAAIMAGLALLALGTAFAFFGKKDECGEGFELDADGNCVPKKKIDVIPAKLVCPPGQHKEGAGASEHCVTDAPDPGDVDDLVKPVPIGGAFYRVKKGDWPGYGTSGTSNLTNANKGFAVAVWYIRRELYEAARERGGLSDQAAWAWVNNAVGGSRVISPANKALDVILCSAFNDACYGTWGYCGDIAIQKGRCPSSMRNHPGPHGRAIRFLTDHAPNISRFKSGDVAARYAGIGNAGSAGDGTSDNKTGKKGYYPELWIPKLDRERLWATGGGDFPQQIEVEPTPENWDDSSPMSSPPPFIMRGGEILDFSGSLHLPMAFGCGDERVNFRFGG